jgi:hypothetical protein
MINRLLKSARMTPLLPEKIVPFEILDISMKFLGGFGFRPPRDQTTLTGPRQAFGGSSKVAFNLTSKMLGSYELLSS